MMVDPHGPIDKLEDLEADDWQALREWVSMVYVEGTTIR